MSMHSAHFLLQLKRTLRANLLVVKAKAIIRNRSIKKMPTRLLKMLLLLLLREKLLLLRESN